MFEQTFVQTPARTRRPWTVAVSLTVQCGVVLLVLLIPLLHPETLGLIARPRTRLISTWLTQPPVPPVQQRTVAVAQTAALHAPVTPRPFLYPVVPAHSAGVAPLVLPSGDAAPSDFAGAPISGGVPVLSAALPPALVAPVAPKPAIVNSGPVRVSQGVEGARLVFSPKPEYPRMAQITHSQGLVKLEAIIGSDGKIRNLRVLSGSPLLVDAALDAVKQWRYQPTLLNGVAVEVVTEIEVNFTLTR